MLPSETDNHALQRLKLKYPPELRLRSSEDFDRVYHAKVKSSDAVMLMFATRNQLTYSRLGTSVSRRNGNSVVRHRIKRQMKEAFRLLQHSLPQGIDLVLIPGRNARTASQAEFQDSLLKLSQKILQKLDERQAVPASEK